LNINGKYDNVGINHPALFTGGVILFVFVLCLLS